MKKVLVVEDKQKYFDEIYEELSNKVEVLHAKTLQEGENLFQNHPDVDLIIMDACVPGDKPNAMPLVKKIVGTGYSKPIIASSGLKAYGKMLIDVGATHLSYKEDVAKMALELLNL